MKPKQLLHVPRHFLMLALLHFILGCGSSIQIIDKPISFSAERVQLTRDYIHAHYGISTPDIVITPRIIVLHWTAIAGFEQSFAAFHPEKLPASRPELQGRRVARSTYTCTKCPQAAASGSPGANRPIS